MATDASGSAPHERHCTSEQRAEWDAAIAWYKAGDTTGWYTRAEMTSMLIDLLVQRQVDAQRAG